MLLAHTAINVVVRETGVEPEFLVFDYRSTDPSTDEPSETDIRFPTGTSQSGEFGESSEGTSVRKLEEETGLKAIETDEITRRRTGGGHIKHVFLIRYETCLGELRQVPLEVDGDWMSAPYWMPVTRLKDKISPVQFWAYRAAVEYLRRQ